jgi:hypothetical protein
MSGTRSPLCLMSVTLSVMKSSKLISPYRSGFPAPVWGAVSCGPRVAPLHSLRFISLLDPLIERLKHSSVHRRDDIHRRVELFFGHSRFPCVRKAAIDSGIAEPHHRDREADQHLLAFGEALGRMRVPIERSEVSFFHGHCSFQAEGTACFAPTNPKPETIFSGRFHACDQRVRKTSLHVHVIAVGVPGEIIFLHALG